jgi:acetyltransferase
LAAIFHRPIRSEITTPLPKRGKIAALSGELRDVLKKAVGPLDEHVSKRILKACGIPIVEEELVADAAQCERIVMRLGFPVVMKGLQKGTLHKTEVGLVHLNITGIDAARRSFETLMEKMNGHGKIIVYRQVKGKIELIVGLLRDIQFGPCVMLGLGGIMAEILSDVVFAPAPLSIEDALGLIKRLRGQKIFDGFRGEPPVNKEILAAIIVQLSDIGLKHSRIHEIDINPLIVTENGALVAVDATIVLR